MGWFASFWQDAPMPTSSAQLVACPPFITDFRNYAAVDIQTAHSFFWEFNNDGTGLRFLDFLGRSEVRFPHSGEAIYICDDRTQYRNSRAITIAAIDMLVSCSVGAVTYRRGKRFDNLVYCPHRFARMFNCDQHIPNILMIAAQGTHSLDFNSYLHNNFSGGVTTTFTAATSLFSSTKRSLIFCPTSHTEEWSHIGLYQVVLRSF